MRMVGHCQCESSHADFVYLNEDANAAKQAMTLRLENHYLELKKNKSNIRRSPQQYFTINN